ncbi:MAG: protein translocase subunit SecF [bacterium]|nr:protein translocase subunit SecF [bacterium]
MSFIKPAKVFLSISGALVAISLVLLVTPGPKLSIDFTGGTMMELGIPSDATRDTVANALETFENDPPLGNTTLSATKDSSVLIRMRDLSNEEHLALVDHFTATIGKVSERQFTTIGPTVGSTLKKRSMWALAIAAFAIILYVAFAFRKIPRKLSPWRFGVIAVVTLLHDVIITVGVFVVISQYTSFEFDTLFITALLTILGYSVNDTIVIFDRIRDNLLNQSNRSDSFEDVAEKSLQQSITRSLNTSISTLIMLCSLFIFGSESIRWFVLTLIVGAVIGTYSSLFIATPLLVLWKKKS